jgi:hypothetical protein
MPWVLWNTGAALTPSGIRIRITAPITDIDPQAAVEHILSRIAPERVIATTTEQLIILCTTMERIIPDPTEQDVTVVFAQQHIVAVPPGKSVRPGPAV